jgi:hypothetical protein
MLAHAKVALEEAQKDMDSGDFDVVSDPDQEEESESRGVSPSGMEVVELGGRPGKAKQAEPPKGKVNRLRVRITTNILQLAYNLIHPSPVIRMVRCVLDFAM